MKQRIIEGELYYDIKNDRFLILEGIFEKFVIFNQLDYICAVKIKHVFTHYTLKYFLLEDIDTLYQKYKHINNNIVFNLLYLENNRLLLQDNIIEFKNIYNAFQKQGKGIIDIDGSLHNLYITQN